ncbi:transcriptional regulator [Amycolatopsis antarctica]|uniref:Transcriptional regulator n=1 Tax=Amycolatopsis antarctica TaxID=1854586 RepID=A0A263D580_9PSEU|nr:helix-turn-helix domain-containing protein [Amycolatopsis antarctica]OZM73531.1 transcriptional regulator [Amycolatopsis antarctica]
MVTEQVSEWFRGDITDPNCPTRLVLDRIGDKWTVLVVHLLRDGPLRFGELREGVGGVAAKVLTQTLRALERDGLLVRTVYPQIPPKVTYELTTLGHSLREPIQAVRDWAESHVHEIVTARGEHATRTG